jgi:hypothetical protein
MEKRFEFSSFDGTRLVGIFHEPSSIQVKAGFLLMHGIPSDKNEWGFYDDMASELGKHGFVSFRFDFRCNGESAGGDISKITLSSLVNDIEAAYQELVMLISGRCPLFAVGTSCGGGVTLRWINQYRRNISRVFLMAPVLDYEYEVLGRSLTEVELKRNLLNESQQAYLQNKGHINSEIHYGLSMVNEAHLFNAALEIALINSPITIFHGNSDTVVPYDKSLEVTQCFKKNVELITIQNADHGFAVEGDDSLSDPRTKNNHRIIYSEMIKRAL